MMKETEVIDEILAGHIRPVVSHRARDLDGRGLADERGIWR